MLVVLNFDEVTGELLDVRCSGGDAVAALGDWLARTVIACAEAEAEPPLSESLPILKA